MTQVRDLQHRFSINGRTFIVVVCACGQYRTSQPQELCDVLVHSCVPDRLLDREDEEPQVVVRQAMARIKRLVPGASSEQWGEFSDVLYAWVCERRAVVLPGIRQNESGPSKLQDS